MDGWLYKAARRGMATAMAGIGIKKLDRRYFKLDEIKLALGYWREIPKDPNAPYDGSLRLSDGFQVERSPDDDMCFRVIPSTAGEPPMDLKADTVAECDEWIRELTRVANTLQKSATDNKSSAGIRRRAASVHSGSVMAEPVPSSPPSAWASTITEEVEVRGAVDQDEKKPEDVSSPKSADAATTPKSPTDLSTEPAAAPSTSFSPGGRTSLEVPSRSAASSPQGSVSLAGMESAFARRSRVTYRIFVHTGTVKGAGTNAKVELTLNGALNTSGKVHLSNKNHINPKANIFRNGQVDEFLVPCVDLGELKSIRIEHDGSGLSAGWFLDKVRVQVEARPGSSEKNYVFLCNRWLDKSQDDGLICRELRPLDSEPKRTSQDGSLERTTSGPRGQNVGSKRLAELFPFKKTAPAPGAPAVPLQITENAINIAPMKIPSRKLGALLQVEVIQARGLSVKALTSLDSFKPCVSLNVEGQDVLSDYRSKTVEPVFNEEFAFVVTEPGGSLEITMLDFSRTGSHDTIGYVHIPLLDLEDRKAHDRWYSIEEKLVTVIPGEPAPPIISKGELRLRIQMRYDRMPYIASHFTPTLPDLVTKVDNVSIDAVKLIIDRFTAIGKPIGSFAAAMNHVLDLRNPPLSIICFVIFMYVALNVHLLLPLLPLLIASVCVWKYVSQRYMDPPVNSDQPEDVPANKRKKSVGASSGGAPSLKEIKVTVIDAQNAALMVVSGLEKFFNLLSWKVPWKTAGLMIVLVIASIAIYIVPFKYMFMALGIHQFTRRFRSPDIPPWNFIFRIPDSGPQIPHTKFKAVKDTEKQGYHGQVTVDHHTD